MAFKEKEVDKVHIFYSSDRLRLFLAFKNGPYAIYTIESSVKEIYRSGANYKESALLKYDDCAYFVVRTSAGIFSINFCRENQETWFLIEDDPLFLLPNSKGNMLISL